MDTKTLSAERDLDLSGFYWLFPTSYKQLARHRFWAYAALSYDRFNPRSLTGNPI